MPRVRGPRVSAPRVRGPRVVMSVAHATQLAMVRAYAGVDPATRRAMLADAQAVAHGSATPGLAQAARGLLSLAY